MAQTAKEREAKIAEHEQRIQDLEGSMAKIAEVAEAVSRHERILKGGDNNEPGLLERTRNIEAIASNAAGWLRALALIFLAQFIAVIFGVIQFFVKITPALLELSK